MMKCLAGYLEDTMKLVVLFSIIGLLIDCAAFMPKPGLEFHNGSELLKHYQKKKHRPIEVKNQVSYSDNDNYLRFESLSQIDEDTARISIYAAFHLKAAELDLKPERIKINLYLPRKDTILIDSRTPNFFLPELSIPMTTELVSLLHIQSPIITPEILAQLKPFNQPHIYQGNLENGRYKITYFLDKKYTRIDSITIHDQSNSKIKISYSEYAVWNSDNLPQKTVIDARQRDKQVQIILNLLYRKKLENEVSLLQ